MRTWDEYKKTMRTEEALFSLARIGNTDRLSKLINDTNVNQQDHKGYSPLMLTAYNGHLETTRWLIKAGADVNLCDFGGNSILMGAAFKGHIEIVKILVEAGAAIDYENAHGQNALQFAQMFGRAEVVSYLNSKLNNPEVYGLIDMISGWTSYLFSKRRAS